jgi:hypothetical protein
MFGGPTINKSDGNLGARAASEENIFGLIAGGVATGTYTLGDAVKLIQPSDADTYGIDAAYDANNAVLVRYHIDEFFRLNPSGELWLLLKAQGTTMAALCGSGSTSALNAIVTASGKKLKGIGVVLNPATGYTPTLTNGLDADVTAAITAAQGVCTTLAGLNVYIDVVVIEGRQVNGSIASIKDLRTMGSPNVAVAILQDADIAALDTLYAKHAAVGTVLGGIGARRVHEDLGSIDAVSRPNKNANNFSIVDDVLGAWLNPAISSGTLVKNLTPAEVTVLKNNGYIWADSYPEYGGVFFSGSPACTLASSDYAYFVNTRVWNKAARLAVKKLTPYFNSTIATVAGGKIAPSTASSWQADVNNSRNGLGTLVTEGNAVDSSVYINPNQVVTTGSNVTVKMSVTPFGYARAITGDLGFSIN